MGGTDHSPGRRDAAFGVGVHGVEVDEAAVERVAERGGKVEAQGVARALRV